MKIQYNDMEFTFHAKPVNGFYFTHDKSGHGLFNDFNKQTFGRPTKSTAAERLKIYIESSPERIRILNIYKERYP